MISQWWEGGKKLIEWMLRCGQVRVPGSGQNRVVTEEIAVGLEAIHRSNESDLFCRRQL